MITVKRKVSFTRRQDRSHRLTVVDEKPIEPAAGFEGRCLPTMRANAHGKDRAELLEEPARVGLEGPVDGHFDALVVRISALEQRALVESQESQHGPRECDVCGAGRRLGRVSQDTARLLMYLDEELEGLRNLRTGIGQRSDRPPSRPRARWGMGAAMSGRMADSNSIEVEQLGQLGPVGGPWRRTSFETRDRRARHPDLLS